MIRLRTTPLDRTLIFCKRVAEAQFDLNRNDIANEKREPPMLRRILKISLEAARSVETDVGTLNYRN